MEKLYGAHKAPEIRFIGSPLRILLQAAVTLHDHKYLKLVSIDAALRSPRQGHGEREEEV